jgi:hypothetical protein
MASTFIDLAAGAPAPVVDSPLRLQLPAAPDVHPHHSPHPDVPVPGNPAVVPVNYPLPQAVPFPAHPEHPASPHHPEHTARSILISDTSVQFLPTLSHLMLSHFQTICKYKLRTQSFRDRQRQHLESVLISVSHG